MFNTFLKNPANRPESFIIGGNVIDYEDKGIILESYRQVREKGEVLDSNFCISGDITQIKRVIETSKNFTQVQNRTFRLKNIEEFNSSYLSSLGNSRTFERCWNLKKVKCPKLTEIGNEVFVDCENLSSLYCPEITAINERSLYMCYNLSSLDC